jgi:hypothetical protein
MHLRLLLERRMLELDLLWLLHRPALIMHEGPVPLLLLLVRGEVRRRFS